MKASAGFVGRNMHGRIDSGYWDTTTRGHRKGSATGSQSGLTGLTDTELRAGLPTGFDSATRGQDAAINSGYPYLIGNPPL